MNKEDQKKLEENMRNFQPQKSKAAEEARRILFGRTDIDHENAATEALKKLKQDNPEDFKSQWNDPEMTGPQNPLVFDNKTGEMRKATIDEIGKTVTIQLSQPGLTPIDTSMDIQNDELAKIAKEMGETHVFPEPWIKAICDYCHDNNCSAQDLIEAHKRLLQINDLEFGGLPEE